MASRARRRFWLVTLHLLAAVLCFELLRSGLSYYLTPLIERPRHPGYWELKPGGGRGHLLGIIGSAMMVVMLGYTLRKRWRPMRRLGALSHWLDFHIWLGIWGPVLVILHSSFKVQGLVAISFWSMIAVATSGVFGRFLYVQIPRAHSGVELDLEEVRALDREMSRSLVEEKGVRPEVLDAVDRIVEATSNTRQPLLLLLARMTYQPLLLRLRVRRVLAPTLARLGRGPAARHLRRRVLRKASLHRRLLLWGRLKELFHYWHVLHKPFAVLMYLFMVVHIAVAWATGYAWGAG